MRHRKLRGMTWRVSWIQVSDENGFRSQIIRSFTVTESEYSVLHHQPLLPLTHQNHYDVATKNLFQKTFGCLKEYSDMVSGGSRVQLINDNSLISRIKYTSLSHGLIKTGNYLIQKLRSTTWILYRDGRLGF